jgi:hypothetical protein
MIVTLPHSLPCERLEVDNSPLKTRNGGKMWKNASGWSIFLAHTGNAAAVIDSKGRIRLRGWWKGIGKYGDFQGTLIEIDDSPRRASIMKQTGFEIVTSAWLIGRLG